MNAIINLDGGVGNLPDEVTVGANETVMLTRKLSEPGVALRFHYHGTDEEQIRFFQNQGESSAAPFGFRSALLIKTLREGIGEIVIEYRPYNPVIASYDKTIKVIAQNDVA
jgi:hypothetical protein